MAEYDRTITITHAKSGLLALVKKVEERGESILLTRNGYPATVLLSPDEYEGLLETLEILADPKIMASIRRSLKDIERGRLFSHAEVWNE